MEVRRAKRLAKSIDKDELNRLRGLLGGRIHVIKYLS